jgi:hypothetical protein
LGKHLEQTKVIFFGCCHFPDYPLFDEVIKMIKYFFFPKKIKFEKKVLDEKLPRDKKNVQRKEKKSLIKFLPPNILREMGFCFV